MEIRYLGTAASEGFPALFCNCDACTKARAEGGKSIRTRSQSIIDNRLLIDFPPDSYMHSLFGSLDFTGVSTLIVTHSHSDHFYPEDLINRGGVYAHMQNPRKMTCYGNDRTYAQFTKIADSEGIADLNDNIEFVQVDAFTPFISDGYTITAMPALHNRSENCYIYLIEKDGKTLLYAHDTGVFPEATWDYLKTKHIDLASLDCNAGAKSDGNNHMGFPDDLVVIERLKEIGAADDKTIFVANHFSHNCGLSKKEIDDIAKSQGMLASYDGFSVIF